MGQAEGEKGKEGVAVHSILISRFIREGEGSKRKHSAGRGTGVKASGEDGEAASSPAHVPGLPRP